MQKFFVHLGLLIAMMGMANTVFARELRIIDNPEKLVTETLQPSGAIQDLNGVPVIASSDIVALVYDYARTNGHLALVKEADRSLPGYTERFKARNPALFPANGAVPVSNFVAVAKGAGIWLPGDEIAPVAVASPEAPVTPVSKEQVAELKTELAENQRTVQVFRERNPNPSPMEAKAVKALEGRISEIERVLRKLGELDKRVTTLEQGFGQVRETANSAVETADKALAATTKPSLLQTLGLQPGAEVATKSDVENAVMPLGWKIAIVIAVILATLALLGQLVFRHKPKTGASRVVRMVTPVSRTVAPPQIQKAA